MTQCSLFISFPWITGQGRTGEGARFCLVWRGGEGPAFYIHVLYGSLPMPRSFIPILELCNGCVEGHERKTRETDKIGLLRYLVFLSILVGTCRAPGRSLQKHWGTITGTAMVSRMPPNFSYHNRCSEFERPHRMVKRAHE